VNSGTFPPLRWMSTPSATAIGISIQIGKTDCGYNLNRIAIAKAKMAMTINSSRNTIAKKIVRTRGLM